ncbi:GNAT family N-acetyltransferase [Amycolatopsis coloradensis]|uniref:GNAT family N-acetyltransferase n=1 Tax=Amycolatopsis coloradensis TaxID=76021 RepID=A0ACD5BGC9_9PSEU
MPTSTVVRAATSADAGAIAKIWFHGWQDGHLGNVPDSLVRIRTRESFWERAAERVGDTTVAVLDGEVAGFVMVVGDEVEQVYVSSDHRGSGVAGVLLSEAERLVSADGHSRAWLAVAPGNARARRFYERCGWVDNGEFDNRVTGPEGMVSVPCRRYVKTVA